MNSVGYVIVSSFVDNRQLAAAILVSDSSFFRFEDLRSFNGDIFNVE